MNSNAPFAGNRRPWTRVAWLACVLACAWLLPGRAMADNECNIDGSNPIAFGTVGGGGATTTGSIRYYCQNDGPAVRSFRVCLYMNPILPGGLDPRRMIQWWPLDYLDYNLYADPAMTQVIGSTTSGHAVYSFTVTMTATGRTYGTIPVYARIPPQTVTAGGYVSQVTDYLRSTSLAGSSAPSAAQCATAPITGQNYTEVSATFANTCYISTATDLDFGSVVNLASARDQTSTISVRCPAGTNYRIGLNYGVNSTGGTVRRLLGPGGNYLTYLLYRNSSRSQLWGNATSNDVTQTGDNTVQNFTVYGRVPAQAIGAPGAYSDTVTVTLTY
ncbi:Csu type fimbrial protein [Pseudoxanthomonas sp. 10H]|uniref:Csu type fimbrial protein n=1 Tax=Pseudoxanthomonas sp. 10H TaxID=3242729 RepID=UPI003557F3A5